MRGKRFAGACDAIRPSGFIPAVIIMLKDRAPVGALILLPMNDCHIKIPVKGKIFSKFTFHLYY